MTHSFTLAFEKHTSPFSTSQDSSRDCSFAGHRLDAESSLLVGESFVHSSENSQLLLGGFLVLAIKADLQDLASIGLDLGALSRDFRRKDNILEDGLMNRSESAGARADLMSTTTKVLVQDSAVGHEDNVFLLELLFQFADQLGKELLRLTVNHVWQEHADSGLLATRALDFGSAREAELTQISLELITRSVLDVEDGLCDLLFELVGGNALRLHNLV